MADDQGAAAAAAAAAATAKAKRKSIGRNDRRSFVDPGTLPATAAAPHPDKPEQLKQLIETSLKEAAKVLEDEFKAEGEAIIHQFCEELADDDDLLDACKPLVLKPNPKNMEMEEHLASYQKILAGLQAEEARWAGAVPKIPSDAAHGKSEKPIYARKRLRLSHASVPAQVERLGSFARMATRMHTAAAALQAQCSSTIDAEAFRNFPEVDNPKRLIHEITRLS